MSSGSFRSVREVPIPEGLTEVQRCEYLACRDAIVQLESEWISVDDGTNPDFLASLALINEEKAQCDVRADERLRLQLEAVEVEAERERNRIAREKSNAAEHIRDRIMLCYFQRYQAICSQIRESMSETGDDFDAFIANHAIEFPPMPPDLVVPQTPEEDPIAIPAEESERDIHGILAQEVPSE
jgi:hypothetical protein